MRLYNKNNNKKEMIKAISIVTLFHVIKSQSMAKQQRLCRALHVIGHRSEKIIN